MQDIILSIFIWIKNALSSKLLSRDFKSTSLQTILSPTPPFIWANPLIFCHFLPLAKPSVIAPQNSYSAVIGTNVTLACVVSVTSIDPPVLTVVWRKMTPSGSGTIDVSGSQKYGGSTTASPDLVIANHNGNYSCLATNAAGTSESGTIVLTVTGSE